MPWMHTGGLGDKVPCILDLCIRWGWVVSFVLLLHYPWGSCWPYSSNRGM